MSKVTDGFEKSELLDLIDVNFGGHYYRIAKGLLDHVRALEDMLRKYEWRTEQFRGLRTCGECGETVLSGHAPDCALAKLLE